METEIRYYYSMDSKEELINFLSSFKELKNQGRFYECTDQYNHPMQEYDFYSKEIDGRFRVRQTKGDKSSKCMVSWKKRLQTGEILHNEQEIEVEIKPDEYDELCFLLTDVLHLYLIESYERYRNVFSNKDVEIVVDEYPFGLCLEIENKSKNKEADGVIKEWVDKLGLKLEDAYSLSWDDKYEELCREQNKRIEYVVRFHKDMPSIQTPFKIKK